MFSKSLKQILSQNNYDTNGSVKILKMCMILCYQIFNTKM